jgi:hypothetical protein
MYATLILTTCTICLVLKFKGYGLWSTRTGKLVLHSDTSLSRYLCSCEYVRIWFFGKYVNDVVYYSFCVCVCVCVTRRCSAFGEVIMHIFVHRKGTPSRPSMRLVRVCYRVGSFLFGAKT